ncbi:MAG TPA: hypothetical protein VF323_05935, partial [Candidatus Limnocylindrales bacterium]
ACSGTITITPASQAPGSTPVAGGSSAIGGFGSAPELEAALPSTLCGQPSKKASAAGTGTLNSSAPPNPFAAFAAGGVSGGFAYAEPASSDCKTSAVAFSVSGGMSTTIMQMMALGAAGSGGGTVSLGGKTVTKIADTPTSTYFYAKGDALFAVEAATDDDAAAALSQMP